MISTHVNRISNASPVCRSIARPDARALAHYHLGRLMAALEELRQLGPEASDTADVACWADEGYLYLEVSRLEGPSPAIDLNVHDGTAFVRIEK